MIRTLLKSKIHRARVTDADLHYEGSVTIDRQLMEAADILEHEQVDVLDITNGARLTTYAIPGHSGSGTICINGAAAHLVNRGDLVIVVTYAQYDERECRAHRPRVIRVDERNQPLADSPPTPSAGGLADQIAAGLADQIAASRVPVSMQPNV